MRKYGMFRRIYLFSFFIMFLVVIPVLVPYFTSLGLSMKEIFELQAVFSVVMGVFEIPTGYLCDHWGRARTLRLGAFISGASFTLLGFVHSFEGLAAYEVLCGAGFSLVSGADVSFLYDSLDGPGRTRESGSRAMADLQFAQVSGEAVASLLGGALAALSFRHILLAQAVAGWVPFVVALGFQEPARRRMARLSHRDNLGRILRHVLGGERLLRLVFLNHVVWGLSTFIAVWLIQRYWEEHGIPLGWFGALWAGSNFGVGLVGKQVHQLERRLGPGPLLLFVGLAPVAAYWGMSSVAGAAGACFGLLFYAARGVNYVLLRDAFNWRVPTEFRATANSIQTFFFRVSFGLTGPGVGAAIDRWGMDAALRGLGVVFLVCFGSLLVPLWLEVRRAAPRGIPEGELSG